MKRQLPLFLALITLLMSSPLFAADNDSKMNIEKVIASCEEQYTAETYPNEEERAKLIEQCIEDNTAGQAAE